MKYLLVFLASIAFATDTFAQASYPHIKVKGEAAVKATPETMEVRIPMEVRALSYEDCNTKLRRTFNALSTALQKAGFDESELKSDRLSVTEAYEYQSGQRVKVGYSGSIQLFIESAHTPENLSRVVNTLQQEAFNFGYTLSFGLSEGQKERLRKQAIQDAVADAREKAEILAEAAGLRLGPIAEINFEFETNSVSPLMGERVFMSAKAEMDQDDINLNPLDQTIRKEVGIIWQLIDPK